MSFNPKFSKYIQIASESYIQPSSSIGALQTHTINSDLEWQYHFSNTQTLINYIADSSEGTNYSVYISGSNQPSLLKSFGPFKINLDKNGFPSPIFVSLNQNLSASVDTNAKYTAVLRLINSIGFTSQVQLGTLVTSSVVDAFSLNKPRWKTFNTPNAQYISSSFTISSSVIATGMTTDPFLFKSRLVKPYDTVPNYINIQAGAVGYLDILVETTGSTNAMYAYVRGVYAREINERK